MKKVLIILSAALFLVSCAERAKKKPLTREQMETMTFAELFEPIEADGIEESVFKLVGEDFSVITSGTVEDYNSMVASWGGWGILFNKPTTWCMLRANRYTLEYIRTNNTYTFCYFDEPFKSDIMIFGTQSGRGSDKMQQHKLLPVATPTGSVAYKEAKLIIECRLTAVTTVSPEDFLTEEGRKFVTDAYAEAGDWHKQVFGEITGVWKKK